MNRFFDMRLSSALLLITITGFLSVGCSVSEHAFDAYDETQVVGEEPDFLTLDLARPVPPEALRPPQTAYRVGPGDVLDIEVAEDEKTRAASRIMPDGMLYYDVADGVKASGHTL